MVQVYSVRVLRPWQCGDVRERIVKPDHLYLNELVQICYQKNSKLPFSTTKIWHSSFKYKWSRFPSGFRYITYSPLTANYSRITILPYLIGFWMSVRLALDIRCDFAVWWDGMTTNSRSGHFHSTESGYKSDWKLHKCHLSYYILVTTVSFVPRIIPFCFGKIYIWKSGYHGCSWFLPHCDIVPLTLSCVSLHNQLFLVQ